MSDQIILKKFVAHEILFTPGLEFFNNAQRCTPLILMFYSVNAVHCRRHNKISVYFWEHRKVIY